MAGLDDADACPFGLDDAGGRSSGQNDADVNPTRRWGAGVTVVAVSSTDRRRERQRAASIDRLADQSALGPLGVFSEGSKRAGSDGRRWAGRGAGQAQPGCGVDHGPRR